MGITISRRVASIAAAAAVSGLVLAGCSSDEGSDTENTAEGTATSVMTTTSASETSTMESEPAGMLVGAGCADYAEANPEGPGSVEAMAMEPVATAASNNPLLTTLTSAVSGGVNPEVDLVDTLNSGEYTVFAPIDDAFAQIDEATMQSLQTDADLLTGILTYHVVEGQAAPDQVVGEHTTLNGAQLEVTGSGDELMVNGAGVVCGGVQTENATVYLIDQVLIPEE
ncbi:MULTISPECIES: fasciclin domain-containing protein [Dietzia]|uniref:Fasciclin domain-containing protein n=1 Tax=Dietzia cinnamea TaxID=321318 RepID=A0AAW5QBU4_9ACTN|nr:MULTISPECIES: fasciclin domain-containing protein [Dietzia]KZO59282.1 fasciclin [Dietzia maris]AVM63789.1 fasciclin domain-containing protein [Dietzia sp. oral taxon 368]MBM7229953.1 fasciclin domain-containing protein [Dietzia cinnamea]MCT1641036.1 fasciclin domain-containing protein [Dietzia cinnamea]MCT1865822.1 fasciclin domain-containing protein [Dietzia cinnamea]